MNIIKYELVKKLVENDFTSVESCQKLWEMYCEITFQLFGNSTAIEYCALRFLELTNKQSDAIKHYSNCECNFHREMAKSEMMYNTRYPSLKAYIIQ